MILSWRNQVGRIPLEQFLDEERALAEREKERLAKPKLKEWEINLALSKRERVRLLRLQTLKPRRENIPLSPDEKDRLRRLQEELLDLDEWDETVLARVVQSFGV
jgi:hypothetical protein